MTPYWILGLFAVLVGLLLAVRRFYRSSKLRDDEVDIPLWDADHCQHVDIWADPASERNDTAPAVLSPPEWPAARPPTAPSRR